MDFSARDAAQAVCGAAGKGRDLRTPLPRESDGILYEQERGRLVRLQHTKAPLPKVRLRTPFDNRCDGVFWERETGCIVRINMK